MTVTVLACGRIDYDPGSDVDATAAIDAGEVPADAPADAPAADAATPADAADAQMPLTPCDVTYGAAPGYVLCQEQPDTCEFNATTNGGNCNEMCGNYGGVCIGAYDNERGTPCVRLMAEDCMTNRATEICICSRP